MYKKLKQAKVMKELIEKETIYLPAELLYKIFQYLVYSQQSLYTVSLVCKQWLRCVAPILYSHPRINDTFRWANFILTLTRSKMSFFYGDLLRSVDLSSGKSIEAMKDQEFYKRLSDANNVQRESPIRFRTIRFSANPTTTENDQDFLIKGLPFIIVSTSSLIQLANTCKNLTCINLSYTSLLHDSVIKETGEYVSTLQHYAIQPGLTHIQIPIKEAIKTLGEQCQQLQHIKIQRCEWVTAHVIWMFVYYCSHLTQLDARRSTKCTVKRLISNVLEIDKSSSILNHNNTDFHINSPTHVEQEPHIDTPATIHFMMNELTGSYEQVNHNPLQQFNTPNNWSFNEDSSSTVKIQSTLKEYVQHIIVDAKQSGTLDLNWIHDYI